ncbi:AraC-like DNA-binding protein [Bradyrhizobium sp. USDA 4472]
MRSRSANGLSSILSATGGIARLACAYLRRKGRDPAPVLEQAGLTLQDIADPKCRVAAAAQVRLLELAAAELEDTHFGLHLARDFELGEIGLVYYVMASSEHLADALANAARYCAINNEGVRLEVSAGRTLSIGLEYLNLDRRFGRHHAEFWVVTLVRIARALTGGRVSPKQITLRYGRPQLRPGIDLGCAIDYGANRDEIAFPEQSAALRVAGADTHLNRILLEYADEALGRRKAQRSSLRSRVEDELIQLLPNGKAHVLEVARRTGMSGRTLARALSDEGTTFSAVLSELRQALAKRYLRDQDLPISEIAWLLGYREVSSFSHAFTGWTGVTPRQFRTAGS